MRLSIRTLLWIVVVVSIASIIGQLVNVLSVSVTEPIGNRRHLTSDNEQNYNEVDGINVSLGASTDHLIWFLQISDLHISVFQDTNRVTQLKEFCTDTVSAIKPSVVLASGDLTDAKTADMLGSRQYVEEWIAYNNTLYSSGVLDKTVWLDIRGNHDNFNIPSLASPNNFYQKYSIQGEHNQRSYLYSLKKGFDSVAFIAVDACLLPGPRRPFNFIGVLTPSEMHALEEFEASSHNHNYTIWFGHYPTSCILSPKPGIRKLMGNGLAYLCGHLHTLKGLVPNMYTRQQTGSLELELADWKDARTYRVAAIDHGLFSFVDVPHGSWPVILVTNPKHSLYTMPHHEPLHYIAHSSHIRVLVWSLSQVSDVRLRFDEEGSWMMLTHVEGPLYITRWNTRHFAHGLHTLEVYARDSKGRDNTIVQPFSLDGVHPSFSFWPRALLMSNISMVFQFLFGLLVCVCVVPLVIIRYLHHLVIDNRLLRPHLRCRFFNAFLRKLWILVSVDRLFWPIILSCVYLPLGPWFIGEVIENHVGIVFAWGTFVNSSYLPGSLTYAYGFIQILTFQIPLILALAHCVDLRFWMLCVDSQCSLSRYICCHLCVCFPITVQVIYTYLFWLAYGTMAVIIGPLRTWSALLGIYLWYQASCLPSNLLSNALQVWQSNYHSSNINEPWDNINNDLPTTQYVRSPAGTSKCFKEFDTPLIEQTTL